MSPSKNGQPLKDNSSSSSAAGSTLGGITGAIPKAGSAAASIASSSSARAAARSDHQRRRKTSSQASATTGTCSLHPLQVLAASKQVSSPRAGLPSPYQTAVPQAVHSPSRLSAPPMLVQSHPTDQVSQPDQVAGLQDLAELTRQSQLLQMIRSSRHQDYQQQPRVCGGGHQRRFHSGQWGLSNESPGPAVAGTESLMSRSANETAMMEPPLSDEAAFPNPQELTDKLTELQQRVSMLRLLEGGAGVNGLPLRPQEKRARAGKVADVEALISEKLELIDQLRQMEDKKERLDQKIVEFLPVHGVKNAEDILAQERIRGATKAQQNREEAAAALRMGEDAFWMQQQEQQPSQEQQRQNQATRIQQYLLAEMQEQLRLQKELHLRRKELEELMRKDLLESLQKESEREARRRQQRAPDNLSEEETKSESSSKSNNWYPESRHSMSPATLDQRHILMPSNQYHRHPRHRVRPSSRSRHLSLSSNVSNSNLAAAPDSLQNYQVHHQLKALQAQIESLHLEMRRLNGGRPASSQEFSPQAGASDRGRVLAQHQQQIDHLTSSMGQVFQALGSLQERLGHLEQAVERISRLELNSRSARGNEVRGTSIDPPADAGGRNDSLGEVPSGEAAAAVPFSLDLAGQNGQYEAWHFPTVDFGGIAGLPELFAGESVRPSPPTLAREQPESWGVQGATFHQAQQPSSSAAPGFVCDPVGQNGPVGGGPEMRGRTALNNQVSPGVRANNYWDNFRSFSRQNRLSSSAAGGPPLPLPPLSSIEASSAPPPPPPTLMTGPISTAGPSLVVSQGPNVAQVPPRQLQSDISGAAAMQGHPAAGAEQQRPGVSSVRQALVEPSTSSFMNISPPRPRRKQKINREQNREAITNDPSAGDSLLPRENNQNLNATAAAMVHPMPQNHQQQQPEQLQDAARQQQSQVALVNLATVSPVVSSLTRSIYSQIGSLVTQHEESPDQLARIYHDLQALNLNLHNAGLPPDHHQQQALQERSAGHSMDSSAVQPRTSAPVHPHVEGEPSNHGSSNLEGAAALNNNRSSPFSSPKLRRPDKRFLGSGARPRRETARTEEQSTSIGEGGEGEEGRRALFSIHNSLGTMSSSLQDSMEKGGENQPQGSGTVVPLDRIGESDTVAAGGTAAEPVGGCSNVPKNVQKQQATEQKRHCRQQRQVPEPRNHRKPKNMQQAAVVLEGAVPGTDRPGADVQENDQLAEHDRGFVKVEIGFRGAEGGAAAAALPPPPASRRESSPEDNSENLARQEDDEGESEMVEADQGHSPDQSGITPEELLLSERALEVVEGMEAGVSAPALVAANSVGGERGASSGPQPRQVEDCLVVGGTLRLAGGAVGDIERRRMREQEEAEIVGNLVSEVLDSGPEAGAEELARGREEDVEAASMINVLKPNGH